MAGVVFHFYTWRSWCRRFVRIVYLLFSDSVAYPEILRVIYDCVRLLDYENMRFQGR